MVISPRNKASMLRHVGIWCMIETEEKCGFFVGGNYEEWCIVGPWFDETTCQSIHGSLFE